MPGDGAEGERSERLLALAADAESHLWGSTDAIWMNRLEKEHDGLRAAFSWFLDHGRGADALELAADLWLFQESRGHAEEARAWLAKALAAPGAEPRSISRARALYGAAILAFRNLDDDTARQAFEECRAIAQEQDYFRLVVRATTGFARLALRRGDTREVRRWSEEALAIARDRGEKEDAASPLHMLAAAACVEGDLRRPGGVFRGNLALHRELGRMDTGSVESGNLGALAVLEAKLAEAQPGIRDSLEITDTRRDPYGAPCGRSWT